MTLSQFFLIVRARWLIGLTVWLGVFAIVLCVSLMMKPQFTSTAAVVVDSKGFDAINGAGGNGGGVLPGYMATQVDVAQSQRVLLRAIKALHLQDRADLREHWQASTQGRGDFNAWLSEELLHKYVVRPSRDSSAITLSYTDPDPKFAVDVTNALVQAYIDTTLELRVEPAKQYNAFFDDRARQMRDALEQAQTKLSAYQQKNGLIATDERGDVGNARLLELNTQVLAMQMAAAEASGREAAARSDPNRMREVLDNSVVSNLQAEIVRNDQQLSDLRNRMGESNPQMIEAESRGQALHKRLDEAVQQASGSVSVTDRVTRQRLDAATRAMAQQRSLVLAFKAKRDDAAVLQRDVENAQRAYDAVLARVSQTDLESQNRQANVSVLQRATQAPFPSAPKVGLNSIIGFVLGLLLGVGATVVRELSDRRLRTELDITGTLGQTLLVVLPRTDIDSRRNENRLAMVKMRLLGGLQS